MFVLRAYVPTLPTLPTLPKGHALFMASIDLSGSWVGTYVVDEWNADTKILSPSWRRRGRISLAWLPTDVTKYVNGYILGCKMPNSDSLFKRSEL
jgi:ABC-type antimicrobial peptide transport system permease subunit